jgi:hypothetical protein
MLKLMADNKGLAMGALALLVVMLALFVVEFVGPRAGPVRDSTSCSQWSSANQAQQSAYAGLYVKEHGSLPSGASDAASVEAAINNGCMQAFGSDVADTVTVVRAIAGGV